MSSPSQFLEDAIEAAKRAVQFDQNGNYEPASYFYNISSKLLRKAADVSENNRSHSLIAKAEQYQTRANALHELQMNKKSDFCEDIHRQRLKQYRFLMQQALDADAAGLKETAVDLYTNAIEFVTKYPELMQGELRSLALQALDRAETLKGIKKNHSFETPMHQQRFANVRATPNLHRGSSVHLEVVSASSGGYTDNEKRVLFHTSKINQIDYVPFMSIDLKEKFQYAFPFTDKDGYLALSPKQRQAFARWVRPEEICQEPCIVLGAYPDYYSIRQTIISDCSFVASLAVSALYERRFGRALVTPIIYPRTKDKKPLYNPFGKYMVKLHLNGVSRKVIIDDYLPVNKYGQLLCSYSNNKSEFWISLLEKAYMKVMGGYDFPGSNSNIDLHALTGWIPERISINEEFNRDAVFAMLESRMAKGDVLVTVATGQISAQEEERTGLVATHAYAVMDVRTVNGIKLLKVKNPWSHVRWRGNYSELDTRHWTPELQELLNYDPGSAAQFDNGVFWIDYDSICKFYEVIYLNWNPELFKFTYCIHQDWTAGLGPVRDVYTIGSNPQFSLDVGAETSGAVWILLSRHIMDIEDFKENREYIAVLVYKGNGKRVYYPNDPPPYIDGFRINSPHYLCKIILSPGSSRKYTLVVSQYEKTATIYYTLRAYATCPFKLNKLSDPFKYTKEISGEWKGASAGGCGNNPTYKNNPRYRIEIDGQSNENNLCVELKGPKQYQIGFEIVINSVTDETFTAPFQKTSTGDFRSGFAVLDLDNIPAGIVQIIPSTFLANQEGPFIMTIKCSQSIQISKDR